LGVTLRPMTHGAPLDQIDLPRIPAATAFAGLPARSVTADDVVQAFMGLAQESDSALYEYFLKNIVRHICGYEEGFLALARGILSDYRWLLAVASRLSLSFAASQYRAVINRVREWSEDHDRAKASGE
jgi:hypothetical protein